MRRFLTALVLSAIVIGAANADVSQGVAPQLSEAAVVRPNPAWLTSAQDTNQSPACCKVCTVGKACGDTCISRDKICHVGRGCACDG